MVSETVQNVLSAESAADKFLTETRLKCSKIIEDAEKYASLICKEKTKAAEKAGEELHKKNKLRAEQYSHAAAEECAREKEIIQKKAARNMDSAVQLILSQLFG